MKKPSKTMTMKKMGLALAGLSISFASNLYAATDSAPTKSAPSKLTGMQIDTRGGLRIFDPCCADYWFALGGRLEFDEILFSGSWKDRQGNFPSGGNIRRAFLALNGGVGDCFTYNLTLDFGRAAAIYDTLTDAQIAALTASGINSTRIGFLPTTHAPFIYGLTIIEEAWIGYTGLWDCTRVRFGQFTPLATMDALNNYNLTSGQMFLESALATRAFDVPSYLQTDSTTMKGLGIILETQFADMFTLGATIYQPAASPLNVYGDVRRSDRLGGALRLTFSPVHECDRMYHLGFLARYQSLNHTDASRTLIAGNNSDAILNSLFFTTPEVLPRNYLGTAANFSVNTVPLFVPGIGNVAGTSDPNLLNVGAIRAKSYNHLVGELGAIWGPVTVQGEYHYTNVQRLPFNSAGFQKGNLSFHGWHGQVGYILTGESRCYDFQSGYIGGIKPCGPCGAWELAARYSYLNLNDKDVFGGSEHNVTLGLNWYINCNVKFAFNYIRANINPTGRIAGVQPLPNTPKRKLDIMAARVQVVF